MDTYITNKTVAGLISHQLSQSYLPLEELQTVTNWRFGELTKANSFAWIIKFKYSKDNNTYYKRNKVLSYANLHVLYVATWMILGSCYFSS